MRQSLKCTLLAIAAFGFLGGGLVACSDDESAENIFADATDSVGDAGDSTEVVDDRPNNATRLTCPTPGDLPFDTESNGFQVRKNEALLNQPAIRHFSLDILANPGEDQVISGTLVTGTLIYPGIPSFIEGEFVSSWTYRNNGWEQLGRAMTDENGEYTIEIAADAEFGEGTHLIYTIIEANQSCFEQLAAVWPVGTRFVISDIDGTLTSSDAEFTTQIANQSYDPQEHPGASEMMNAWFDKGYQVVYLTARPNDGRMITRQWLIEHEFPLGPLETADGFVFGSGAEAYKEAFTSHILDDLGWEFEAGYGNSDSDFDGYVGAGAPVSKMFAIEGAKGYDGTTAIANDDYRPHTASFVTSQPEVSDPVQDR